MRALIAEGHARQLRWMVGSVIAFAGLMVGMVAALRF